MDYTGGEEVRKSKKKDAEGRKQFKPVGPKKQKRTLPRLSDSDSDLDLTTQLLADNASQSVLPPASASMIPSSVDISSVLPKRKTRINTQNPVPGTSAWNDDYAAGVHGE